MGGFFMARPKFKEEKARLVAAFDASGKEDQRVLVVAGFISRPEDWQSFHTEWTKRLEEDGLTYFHMVDFASSRRQFTRWNDDEPRRKKLLGDLMAIIQAHVYRKFGSMVINDQFYKLSQGNQKKFALNAYSLSGRTCVADVSKWRQQQGLSHVPTGYVFEEGDNGAALLSERLLKDGHSRPYFLSKKDRTEPDGTLINAYTPLQAADMLAYELAKRTNEVLEGKSNRRLRWALRVFDRIPGEPGYYSPKNLLELNEKLEELSVQIKR